jgi:hypothetical protein
LYRVAKATTFVIVEEFFEGIRTNLLKVLIQFPSEQQFKVLTPKFEALHDILYLVIDGLHLPILACVVGREDYYYHYSFHSALLWGIVDADCKS